MEHQGETTAKNSGILRTAKLLGKILSTPTAWFLAIVSIVSFKAKVEFDKIAKGDRIYAEVKERFDRQHGNIDAVLDKNLPQLAQILLNDGETLNVQVIHNTDKELGHSLVGSKEHEISKRGLVAGDRELEIKKKLGFAAENEGNLPNESARRIITTILNDAKLDRKDTLIIRVGKGDYWLSKVEISPGDETIISGRSN